MIHERKQKGKVTAQIEVSQTLTSDDHVSILYQYYINIIKILYHYYINIISILYQYYINIISILFQ